MPRVPHGRGLDKREKSHQHLSQKHGLGFEDVRKGHQATPVPLVHGQGLRGECELKPKICAPFALHGTHVKHAAGPPPSGGCSVGQWNFALACQSGQLLSVGVM